MFLRWLRSLLLATLLVALVAGAGLSYAAGETLALETLIFVLGLVAALNYVAAGVLDSAALSGRPRSTEAVAASKGLWSAAGVVTLAGLATIYSVFAFRSQPEPARTKELASASYPPGMERNASVASATAPATRAADTAVPAAGSGIAPTLPATIEPGAPGAIQDAIPFSPEQ